jgi:hypothetical protein
MPGGRDAALGHLHGALGTTGAQCVYEFLMLRGSTAYNRMTLGPRGMAYRSDRIMERRVDDAVAS